MGDILVRKGKRGDVIIQKGILTGEKNPKQKNKKPTTKNKKQKTPHQDYQP